MPSTKSKSHRQVEIETRILGLSEVLTVRVVWDADLQNLLVNLHKLSENKLLAVLGRLTDDLSNRKATKRVIVELLDAIHQVLLLRTATEQEFLNVVNKRLRRNPPTE